MSAFNNGGGTLKSTNKPAALLELAHLVNEAERAASTTDNPVENIDITYATNARVATITATVPITNARNSAGQVVTTASSTYLPGSTFNGGSGGDLKSTTLPGAFIEMAYIVQEAELLLPTVNNLTISSDSDAGQMTITANLPFVPSLDANGRTLQTATDYLP